MRVLSVVVVLVGFALLNGCAGMVTSQMKEQHPVGYGKLVKLVPACDQPPLESASGCGIGAEMLEAKTPEKASILFMSGWEKLVFGSFRKKAESGEITDTLVYGKVQRQTVNALQTISVPVLASIYDSNRNEYTRKMSKLLEVIDIDSRSSLDMFRDGHLKASMN
jgi:hypothetical protein